MVRPNSGEIRIRLLKVSFFSDPFYAGYKFGALEDDKYALVGRKRFRLFVILSKRNTIR